jgi:hypothetical protein
VRVPRVVVALDDPLERGRFVSFVHRASIAVPRGLKTLTNVDMLARLIHR